MYVYYVVKRKSCVKLLGYLMSLWRQMMSLFLGYLSEKEQHAINAKKLYLVIGRKILQKLNALQYDVISDNNCG